MNRFLRLLFGFLLLAQGACTQRTSDTNKHLETPNKLEEQLITKDSTVIEAALMVENYRGEDSQPLVDFFNNHLTLDFFENLVRENNPSDKRAVTKFHLRFAFNYRQYPKQKEVLSKLAFDYYQRLLNSCDRDFDDCQLISYLSGSIYAGDVFSTAERFISENGKNQFIKFITSVGRPHNNPHIIRKKIDHIVDEMERNQTISREVLDEMTNSIIYLASKSTDVGLRPLQVLKQLIDKDPLNTQLSHSYERILVLSLNLSIDEDVVRLAQKYISEKVRKENLLSTINHTQGLSLIQWDILSATFSLEKNWKELYSLLGIIKRSESGPLHSYIFSDTMKESSLKTIFLSLVDTYVYKQFVLNIYKSHKAIGDVFKKELAENSGRVESIFIELFDFADNEITEVWLDNYRSHILSIERSLSRFYGTDELQKINRASSKLEVNLRNLIGYPVLFIIGYYATKQGNFDLKGFTRSGAVLHMNHKLYFHELFIGRMGQYLNSINANRGQAQDILLGFYTSLDQNILDGYGLDLEFVESFSSKYLQADREFLDNLNLKMDTFFERGTVADQFSERCNKLFKGDLNFTHELNFISSRNLYFHGQLSTYEGSTITPGSSKEFSKYLKFYNDEEIKTGLSNDLETIRIDMGPRLNHIRILRKALSDQGLATHLESIDEVLDSVERKIDKVLTRIEETYKNSLDCSMAHNDVETKMRLYFFKKEIEYIKSTYAILKILNSTENLELSSLRSRYPEDFKLAYLRDFPQEGNFLNIANARWKSFGNSIKDQISDYKSKVLYQTGFKKSTNGRYKFHTNVFEHRFRRLSYFKESPLAGQEFPNLDVIGIPENYEALTRMFSHVSPLFVEWGIGDSIQSPEDLVFKVFDTDYKRQGGFASVHEVKNHFLWRTVMLNLGNLAKVKVFQNFNSDYDYWNYRTKTKPIIESHFDYVEKATQYIINHWNITSEEASYLEAIRHHNFLRETEGITHHGRNYVLYDNTIVKKDLAMYDVFFHVITAYQLGLRPQFRNEIYTTGHKMQDSSLDSNPIVNSWIPVSTQIDEAEKKGKGQNIKSEEITIRRDMIHFAKVNAEVLTLWDENNLFKLNPKALKLIRHGLFQPVMSDHALADIFIAWTQEKEASGEGKVPYRMDLDYQTAYHDNPDFILPSILSNYYSSKNNFHRLTKMVFKKAENPPQ